MLFGLAFSNGFVPRRHYELLELRVGDRSLVYPETVNRDQMHWLSVGHIAIVAAHPKSSARNPDHSLRRGAGRRRIIDACRSVSVCHSL